MHTPRRVLFLATGLLATVLTAICSGCGGAGLLTGIGLFGGSKSNGPAPEITVGPGGLMLPLAAQAKLVAVTVTNSDRAASASRIEVRLSARGATVDQPFVVKSGNASSTTIWFTLDTGPIVVAIGGDPTLADVPATLEVLADDQPVTASPVPVTLLRQPIASLPDSPHFLSPIGERLDIQVDGLRSQEVQVVVRTTDESGQRISRFAANVQVSEPLRVSADMPGNPLPTAAEIVVIDQIAGASTPITDAYYRPDILAVLPGQGPATGGTVLTVLGTALAPATGNPRTLDLDAVHLSLQKGGRITRLTGNDIRREQSDIDRLVFTVPGSPDGRPGRVELELRVDVDPDALTRAADTAEFLYANANPLFGPRGAVLDQLPVATAAIRIDNAPSTDDAPDLAVLTDAGGVGFLQLFLALQNGMFQPFGTPRLIGGQLPAERHPRDLCVGDFNGDHIPDLFVVNEGSGGGASHHLVLGQEKPLPPLDLDHVRAVAAAGGSCRGRAAFFDGDQRADVLLVPGPGAVAARPHVLLARGTREQPTFVDIEIPVRAFAYEAFEVADLDGDGFTDVALVNATEDMVDIQLEVAYGSADGMTFAIESMDFAVPGYMPNVNSPAVGLHACRDQIRQPQRLGLVLSGIRSQSSAPTVTVLRPIPSRRYAPTAPSPFLALLMVGPIGRSLAADLDQTAPIELVIGTLAPQEGSEDISLLLMRLDIANDRFEPILPPEGDFERGGAAPQQLAFDTAFPALPPFGGLEAVFVVERVGVDGQPENRLSTRLVALPEPPQVPYPRLTPLNATQPVAFPIDRLVAGRFQAVGTQVGIEARADDLALVNGTQEIALILNDGFGGFPGAGHTMSCPDLLPHSVTLTAATAGSIDGLVFCTRDARLGFWRDDPDGPSAQTPDALTAPLVAPLLDDARMQVVDVNGDDVPDLVVLLSFDVTSPTEGDASIALLLGKPSPQPDEFPFYLPVSFTAVHGNASSFAIGNFATGSAALELAVAVPIGTTSASADGNHIRFYRYIPGGASTEASFETSSATGAAPYFIAGNGPSALAASDIDLDGRDDLVVAFRGDHTLRWFRNTAAPGQDVDVGAFLEGLASPFPLAAGEPTQLHLRDVNGDDQLDLIVFVEGSSMGASTTSVATYLNGGTGDFDGPRFVSRQRTGDSDPDHLNRRLSGCLGDWNRDGVVDLFLGWDVAGTPTSSTNLRVLFGGTR